MFTGLVREVGTIRSLARRGEVTRLVLRAPACAPGLAPGDSLAVNGICLTVTARRGPAVMVEAVAETRRVTTLGRWRCGDRVHLEPALRVGEPLGGHLVQGHVDGVGVIAARARRAGAWLLTVVVPPALVRGLRPKGSVALDGVSLTLDAGPFTDRFTVSLVPHTLGATRLGALRPGEAVNIELDALARAAADGAASARRAGSAAPALTLANLVARGFGRGGST